MSRGRTPRIQSIRAAVLRKPGGPLEIEQLQLEGPRDDEVLVRLVASGICHTDIDFSEAGVSSPVVLGHEGAGIVEEVGQTVSGVRRGDHVVLSYQSCGHCPSCKEGHPANCRHFWELNFGFARLDGSNALAASGVRGHFFGQSSFATHTLATERNLVNAKNGHTIKPALHIRFPPVREGVTGCMSRGTYVLRNRFTFGIELSRLLGVPAFRRTIPGVGPLGGSSGGPAKAAESETAVTGTGFPLSTACCFGLKRRATGAIGSKYGREPCF